MTKLEYAKRWKHFRDISDEAFYNGDGALSAGASLQANMVAKEYKEVHNLRTTDQAVAEMRYYLERSK